MDHPDSGFGGSDDVEADESMDVERDDDVGEEDERDPKRFRASSDDDGLFTAEPEPIVAPAPKKGAQWHHFSTRLSLFLLMPSFLYM